ncbi:Uncharacterised protein [Serratia fonticola]|uniref:Uncharacterized protein n=1 Tax=Serratia fonticola TaxID=47917 RepID=A0A4U9WMM0_SERFO|nr:Uncharacterised protein [Serratia fonticola]
MIPMISSMEEVLWVKDQLAEVKQSLRAGQIPFDEKNPARHHARSAFGAVLSSTSAVRRSTSSVSAATI